MAKPSPPQGKSKFKVPQGPIKLPSLLLPGGRIPWYSIKLLNKFSLRGIWDKVFKNGPSKSCGRQPLKNFTLSILEYFALIFWVAWKKLHESLQKISIAFIIWYAGETITFKLRLQILATLIQFRLLWG